MTTPAFMAGRVSPWEPCVDSGHWSVNGSTFEPEKKEKAASFFYQKIGLCFIKA